MTLYHETSFSIFLHRFGISLASCHFQIVLRNCDKKAINGGRLMMGQKVFVTVRTLNLTWIQRCQVTRIERCRCLGRIRGSQKAAAKSIHLWIVNLSICKDLRPHKMEHRVGLMLIRLCPDGRLKTKNVKLKSIAGFHCPAMKKSFPLAKSKSVPLVMKLALPPSSCSKVAVLFGNKNASTRWRLRLDVRVHKLQDCHNRLLYCMFL